MAMVAMYLSSSVMAISIMYQQHAATSEYSEQLLVSRQEGKQLLVSRQEAR
jgi:hypothetical protein